jgi:hypothetical protein
MTLRRHAKLGFALTLLALALPASASAQATRTWVSGVGDDQNPCSRTAPCKTFAGAISKTAAGGIMMALDDGSFGSLTIGKPITVDGGKHQAGMLAANGSNGINVSIDPAFAPANHVTNGRVVLKNLRVEGNVAIPPTGGFTPGLNGVRITHARSVKLHNVDIGFFSRSGVSIEPPNGTTSRVVVNNSQIHDNGGAGVMAAPAGNGVARVSVRSNQLDDNGCGIVASRFGISNVFATNCGTNAPNTTTGTVAINAFDNQIADSNTSAVLANGNSTTIRIGANSITGSLGPALSAPNTGSILTWDDNWIAGNPGGDGASTGTILFQKRLGK